MNRACSMILITLFGGAIVAPARAAQAPPSADRVLVDASGREVLRTRTWPDGSTETSRLTWTGPVKRASVTERRDATGRLVHREQERFDDHGRLAERVAIDVDAAGHEQGWRKVYSYDPAGQAKERTAVIK